MTLAADSKEGIMMNMNKTRIDECMDLLDEEFLTEIEMEELALTEQEQNNIQQNVLEKHAPNGKDGARGASPF